MSSIPLAFFKVSKRYSEATFDIKNIESFFNSLMPWVSQPFTAPFCRISSKYFRQSWISLFLITSGKPPFSKYCKNRHNISSLWEGVRNLDLAIVVPLERIYSLNENGKSLLMLFLPLNLVENSCSFKPEQEDVMKIFAPCLLSLSTQLSHFGTLDISSRK